MKVAIIGAQGMLGQELARVFSADQPLLWDRNEIDITDHARVQRMITEAHPDVVINAAAFNDVDGAEQKKEIANLINGLAVGYLAKAVQEIGGILVHYSTDYVFRGDSGEGYRETDTPDPQSAYAASKALGERELQKHGGRYYLIRLSRLFGRPATGAGTKKSFVDTMLTVAKTRATINVIDAELSCPTYAPDLARQTMEIIAQQRPFGIYHVTNSGACTWYGFAKEIFTSQGIRVTLHPVPASAYPRAAARPEYSVLLNTKLPPLRHWQEALREYLER